MRRGAPDANASRADLYSAWKSIAQEYFAARSFRTMAMIPPALLRSTETTSLRSGFPSRSRAQRGSTSQSMRAPGNVSRSAEAAGMAWITSPIELSLRSRNRGSAIALPPKAREEVARRMLLGIADDGHANAEKRRKLAFGDGVRRVIGTLRVDVGLELAKQRFDVELVEKDHVADGRERCDQSRARPLGEDRAALALEF